MIKERGQARATDPVQFDLICRRLEQLGYHHRRDTFISNDIEPLIVAWFDKTYVKRAHPVCLSDYPMISSSEAKALASSLVELTVKVGDPALDSKTRPCTILAIADGYALCRYQDTPGQKHPVRAVKLHELRPASYTVALSESLVAIVEPKGVTIEGITFSLGALNGLVDAADRLIDPKTPKS